MPGKQRIQEARLANGWIEIYSKRKRIGWTMWAGGNIWVTLLLRQVRFRRWFSIGRQKVHFACVSPALLGRYSEIRANAGDPDRDCGKIVTIGGISGFGRNPTRVWKSGASSPSAFSEPSRFDFWQQPSLWSVPREQLWISCEPASAALSWMDFYFAGVDLLTQTAHHWQLQLYLSILYGLTSIW